jgi:hypothetical protein
MLGKRFNGGMFQSKLKATTHGLAFARADGFMKLNTLGKSLNCGMFHSKLKATPYMLYARTC